MSDNEKPYSGPAFPVLAATGQFMGMTLRDYFAAAALQGSLSDKTFWAAVEKGRKEGDTMVKNASEIAYAFADAMLETRAK